MAEPTVTEGDRDLAKRLHIAVTHAYHGDLRPCHADIEEAAAEIAARVAQAVFEQSAADSENTAMTRRHREAAEVERNALRERLAKLEAIVQRLADCTDMAEAINLKHEAAALLA